jgi:hypothetical protein
MLVAGSTCALLFARGRRPTGPWLQRLQLYSIRVSAVVLGAAADLGEASVSE